jgi:DNA-binding CsgD family transcriptional regulator
MFTDKTNQEKEDIILDLVSSGDINVDLALEIAIKEGIEV